MHIRAKPPVFVPQRFWSEIEKLSKAALMDMVWDYASRTAGDELNEQAIITEIRETRGIVLQHRKD
jgi:hypothetical protein